MNCKFCNAELPEDVSLCPECGKENMEEVTADTIAEEVTEETTAEEVTEETTAEEVTEETSAEEAAEEVTEETAEEATEAEVSEEAPKKKRSLWVTILAVAGGIALAAVLVGAVLYGMNAANKLTTTYTVSDSKAQKERSTVVATVGSEELTNSELQVYYWQGINDFYSYIGYYMDVSALGLDLTQPLDQQFYDEENGTTWQQYFLDGALNTWHRYAALATQAKAEGFALDESAQVYLDSIPQQLEDMAVTYGYESGEDMLAKDMGAACDVAGYMRFIQTNYFVGQYFDSLYKTLEPSLEELEAYYAENEDAVLAMGIADDGSRYVDVRHILFTPQGGTVDEETGSIVYS